VEIFIFWGKYEKYVQSWIIMQEYSLILSSGVWWVMQNLSKFLSKQLFTFDMLLNSVRWITILVYLVHNTGTWTSKNALSGLGD
jgi:hypothetical protein